MNKSYLIHLSSLTLEVIFRDDPYINDPPKKQSQNFALNIKFRKINYSEIIREP